MPFLAALPAWLGPVLAAGGSAAAGALNNRSRKSTSTRTETRTLSPGQQRIEDLVGGRLEQRLLDPYGDVAPVRVAALDRINQSYANMGDRMVRTAGARGYGRSGSLGTAIKGAEFERGRQVTDLEARLAEYMLGRDDTTLGLAQRFYAMPESMTSSGTMTGGGNMLGGALSGGMETLTLLTLLDKLLKGGGVLGGKKAGP